MYIQKIVVATPDVIRTARSLRFYSQPLRLLKCFLFETILFLPFLRSNMKIFNLFLSIIIADIYCLYRFSTKRVVWFLISVLIMDTFFWVSQLKTHFYSNPPWFPTWTAIRMGLIYVFLVTSVWYLSSRYLYLLFVLSSLFHLLLTPSLFIFLSV